MGRDYTGVETTCGDINDVIKVLEGVIETLEKPFDETDKERIIQELKDLFVTDLRRGLAWPLLEELRKANANLRDFGNDTYKELKEVKEQFEDAQNEVYDLKQRVAELEKELPAAN